MTTRSKFVTLVLVGSLIGAIGGGGGSASAHAGYADSSPAFAAELPASPDEIVLTFTQELFRRAGANTIVVTGEDGTAVDASAAAVSNADRRQMTVSLPAPLAPGRYVVSWTNLSADDGDTDAGSFPFYVGRGPSDEERDHDRDLAADLLIPYPGDVADDEAQRVDPPAPPAPPASRAGGGGGLGAGVILLGALGVFAVLGLGITMMRTGADQ